MSMFDDWMTTVSTNAASAPPRTLTEFAEEMRRLKELIHQPEFDCIVCLPRHMERFKAAFPSTNDLRMDWFAGLPLYVERTAEEATARAIYLRSKGGRPLLVRDPDGPPSGENEQRQEENG